MSGSSEARGLDPAAVVVTPAHPLYRQPIVAGAVGVVAFVGSLAIALFGDGMRSFYFSYLTAYLYFLTIALGGMFFVLALYVCRAAWGVTLRRIAENVMATLPLFAILFLPIWIGRDALFTWADPAVVAEDHLLQVKAPFLNPTFFAIRAIFYFACWTAISMWFSRQSAAQDESGDPEITRRLQGHAAPGLIVFSLTATFASIDWAMSLDPHWYSTIFGVYFFAGSTLAILSTLVLLAGRLDRAGLLGGAVTTEHFHDLGKLMFGFTVFWAYIGFSQFFLIWYANIPEETIWYLHRLEHGWKTLTVFLAVGHFAVPFFFLMPRAVKRNRTLLTVGAVWILAMHYFDLYWCIMPVFHHDGPSFGLLDATTLVAVGGFFLAAVGLRARGRAVIPVRDPRLREALAFENL